MLVLRCRSDVSLPAAGDGEHGQMLWRNQPWSYQSVFLCLWPLQVHEQVSWVVFNSCRVLVIHAGSQWVYHAPLGVTVCYLWWCVPELYKTESSVTQGGSCWLWSKPLSWKWLKRLSTTNHLEQNQSLWDFWKIAVSDGDISSARSLVRILAGIMSGPQALFGLILLNTFFSNYDVGHWLARFSSWLWYVRYVRVCILTW